MGPASAETGPRTRPHHSSQEQQGGHSLLPFFLGILVNVRQVVLRVHIPAFRGGQIQFEGFRVILLEALTIDVGIGQALISGRAAQVRRDGIPTDRLLVFSRFAQIEFAQPDE